MMRRQKKLSYPGFRSLLVSAVVLIGSGSNCVSMNVYLFPGQGADYRLFNNMVLPQGYDTVHIHYPVPEKGMSMKDYALSLLPQIDTTQPMVLIGVSLGGMLCTELTDILHPEKTLIISSAKCRSELPGRFTFMRGFPVYKAVPRQWIKTGSYVAQPLVEPDRKNGKETFVAMLRDKDPRFMKRSIDLIIKWDRTTYDESIVHIHGNNDSTLPLRFVKARYVIDGGSHMMVFTRASEINEIIDKELSPIPH